MRVLLDDPLEQTIDPARMGALAKGQWAGTMRDKAKEAWVYPLGWILYFDDKGVVTMLRPPAVGLPRDGVAGASMAAAPDWFLPGDHATVVWHGPRAERSDGTRLYQVAGPELAGPDPPRRFLLAPTERDEFAPRLYGGRVGLQWPSRVSLRVPAGPRRADRRGRVSVAISDEIPVLPLVEAWKRETGRPRLPYLADIAAFMPADQPLYVDPTAHAHALREPECFRTAWVCDECGDAADAGVFLWTAHGADEVRVCLLIHNDAGVWKVSLHPFEFPKESPHDP